MNNKYIGILTSGGDASGMNAAIRAVTRTAIFNGFKIKGIYRGYEGLIAGEVKELTTEDVSSIIQRGGTILKTARSEAFTTPEGRKKAYEVIQKENISALIIIGGDGSLTGARIFAEEYNVTCIGLPGTIDNDLYGTDFTIGYDTALNTIVECVDKIRDTATSHDRIFFVEVMGRDAGFLAQNSAIASGAEAAIIPEDKTDVDQLEIFIGRGFRKTKNSSIVIVTESPQNKNGGAMYYADRVKKEYPEYDVRVSILGHLQRGGAPSANDRILASRLGEAAIQALMEDQQNVMIGIRNNEIVYVPFAQAIKNDKPIDKSLIRVCFSMRKLCTCLFYGLCVFTIVFSLFWMALPKLSLPVPDPGSEAPPSSAADLAAQAMPELAAQSYRLCDKGGRVAVYRCGTNGQPDVLVTVTGIYTNLLPENDAVRIKRGVTVYSERELDLLLEDLGG